MNTETPTPNDNPQRTVRNTARDAQTHAGAMAILGESMFGAGGSSGAIERQEADGQEEIVESDVIPTRLMYELNEQRLEDLGFQLGVPVEGDDLFRYARLPDGWSKKPTDHSMWSTIVDQHGRERFAVFYKAAFYDRGAHMSETPRFSVATDYDFNRSTNETKVRAHARDAGTTLHTVTIDVPPELTAYAASDQARWQCTQWLDQHRPGHDQPDAWERSW